MAKAKQQVELVQGNVYHVWTGNDWVLMRYYMDSQMSSNLGGTWRTVHDFRTVLWVVDKSNTKEKFIETKNLQSDVRPASAETVAAMQTALDRIAALKAQIKEVESEIAQLGDI
jgi:hypothetical protein